MQIIQETRHRYFPVLDHGHDNLVGVVIVKDILDAMLKGEKEPCRDLKRCCLEPMVVPETLKIRALCEAMRTKRHHIAFVFDEYGSR